MELEATAPTNPITTNGVECTNGLTLLAQGAEARVYEMPSFLGRPCIIKERFTKSYRLPVVDTKLTSKRITQEVRCMLRCARAGVHAPCVYLVNQKANRIYMEKVIGRTLKQFLFDHYSSDAGTYGASAITLMTQLGAAIAKIHDADMVHGDLTTSNFLVKDGLDGATNEEEEELKLVVIDFGLGFLQPLPEDKGVDLYVLERAFVSTHPNSQPLVDQALQAYKSASRRSDGVLKKLADVRRRGRKRDMFG